MKFYRATWSRSLVVSSALCTLLCLGIAFCPHTAATPANPPFFWLRAIPLLLLAGSALFVVRGYGVTPEAILVRRLGWSTRLPLAGVSSAEVQPGALKNSIRLFGNGGLFSFTGLYQNASLGKFRAFVTDPQRTVIVRTQPRTYVFSPDDPESFVQSLSALR